MFQDSAMKTSFNSYSEILFLDATYKVNELRIPAIIFLVEDSLGQSEVVAVALLVNETKDILIWLLETFARENDLAKLRVVMADKDINERNRISDILGVPKMRSFVLYVVKSFIFLVLPSSWIQVENCSIQR